MGYLEIGAGLLGATLVFGFAGWLCYLLIRAFIDCVARPLAMWGANHPQGTLGATKDAARWLFATVRNIALIALVGFGLFKAGPVLLGILAMAAGPALWAGHWVLIGGLIAVGFAVVLLIFWAVFGER